MRIDQALAIAGKARIRRCIAAPSDNAEAPPERPVALRDARGRYLKGWAGGPGRPPRDALRELYVNDLFHVWKTHGRKLIRRLAEEDPAAFLRTVLLGVAPLSRTWISSTCWCQGALEVIAPLLIADVRSLS